MFESTVSPSELRDQHPEEKRRSDFHNHLWAYLILRPISFYLAAGFIRVGISPNQITIIGGVILGSALSLLLIENSFAIVTAGAFLVNLWYLIDFTDGVVARYNNMSSVLGAFIDWFIGIIYHALLPFAVGITLYQTEDFITLGSLIYIPAWVWLVVATVGVMSLLLRRTVIQKSRLLRSEDAMEGVKSGINLRMLVGSIVSFKAPCLLIAAIFGALDIWLLFYAVYDLLILGPAVIIHMIKLRSL